MGMNNKHIGTAFEREVCELLKNDGWWVHFMTPDARGAQPFDIIAVKNGIAIAADCKTSSNKIFPLSRLEDNQIMAFEKWRKCGNGEPFLFVKYGEGIRVIPYRSIIECGKIDLRVCIRFENFLQWKWRAFS